MYRRKARKKKVKVSGAAALSQANASLSARPGIAPSSPVVRGNGEAVTPGRGEDVDTEGEEGDEYEEDPLVAIARDFPGWTVEDHLKEMGSLKAEFKILAKRNYEQKMAEIDERIRKINAGSDSEFKERLAEIDRQHKQGLAVLEARKNYELECFDRMCAGQIYAAELSFKEDKEGYKHVLIRQLSRPPRPATPEEVVTTSMLVDDPYNMEPYQPYQPDAYDEYGNDTPEQPQPMPMSDHPHPHMHMQMMQHDDESMLQHAPTPFQTQHHPHAFPMARHATAEDELAASEGIHAMMASSPLPVQFDMRRMVPPSPSMRSPSPLRGRKKPSAFVWKNGRAKPVVYMLPQDEINEDLLRMGMAQMPTQMHGGFYM